MDEITPKTLNLTAVAQYIGVSKATLYNQLRAKLFDVRPIPGTKPRRWSIDHIDAWRNGETYPRTTD